MNCDFERREGFMVCRRGCGTSIQIVDESFPAERYRARCRLSPFDPAEDHGAAQLSDPTLLGNRMQTWFSAIGITKEWFAEMTGEIGEPGCGGCDSRQEYINKAHRWLRKKLYGV